MRLLHGLLSRMFPPQPIPIAEADAGAMTTVRGRVVPRDLLDSPLTGDHCVYYRHAIEQWRQSRVASMGGDGFWEIMEQDEAIVEFYVEDATGRAIVAPEQARVAHGRKLADQTLDLGFNRRGRQLIIQAGDTIEVRGQAALVDDLFDDARGYRSSPRRLILHAPAGSHLAIRIVART